MRIKSVFLPAAILILTGLGSCGNVELPEVSGRIVYEVRVHPVPKNGFLRLSESKVPGSTYVTVYANPAPGYVLQGLSRQNESASSNPSPVNWSTPVYSMEITSHMAITGTFVPKDPAKFTISVDSGISGGIIYPERYERAGDIQPAPTMSESSGTKIKLTILPEPGLDIAGGSLKVTGVASGTAVSVSAEMPYIFTLPGEDVLVEARFEKLQPQDLKERAWKYLEVGEYDTAAELYEAAWKLDKNDPELILYSTFGLLGALLTDYDVRALLGYGSLYFSPVPGTINDWVCDNAYWTGTNKWYKDYAATIYTPKDANLPQFYNRFSGFIKPFGDSPISQEPGRDHLVPLDRRDTREKFSNYIFWALISSYRSGFNPLIEKVNRYVFGKKFDEALARAQTLPAAAKVRLNPRLLDRFGLDDIYAPDGNGDYYIGKPELDYIFGNLLAVRAVFDYLSAYDLSADLRNWLMDYVYWDHGLNEILRQMFDLQTHPSHKNLWREPGTVAKMLPLKNNFLRIRDARGISKAKDSITQALEMTNYAMNYWYGSSGDTARFTADAKDKRLWARQAWAQAKDALEGRNNGIFYFTSWFPRSLPGSSWPNAGSGEYHPDIYDGVLIGDANPLEVRRNRIYGVNVSRFFTPGAFTLTNLFTTELGGTAPSLYKIEWYEDYQNAYTPMYTGKYSPVTARFTDGNTREELTVNGTLYRAPFRKYSFEVNTAYLKELFPKGFGAVGDENGGKELVYKVFPSIPLWPWAVTYFSGNSPASKLYEVYHKITVD
ncbi:MAG: hypothetical protein LBB72_09725 [Spirochaetaceae bacterium]|jgi:hypothetical protein|nr:hypothetical protein [Spirochaetaceae bacterium]